MHTKIIIIGIYFGKWPIWFPAFLLSCAKNDTIEWLFFTDCEIPCTNFHNIRFERMDLSQLNSLASTKLGFTIQKDSYSQLNLRPAYGVIFEEYIEGFEFWGHCDFDIIWGAIRDFFTEDLLHEHDIVSGRKDFLAGHLTLWRNKPEMNSLFRQFPNYRDIFSAKEHYGFDESILSIFLRNLTRSGSSKVQVYWPKDLVAVFNGKTSPIGWYWANGKIFDAKNREHIYLHFQHWQKKEWKRAVSWIDFQAGDNPKKFKFTRFGIQSRWQSVTEAFYLKFVREELIRVKNQLMKGVRHSLRVLKRIFFVKNFYWAQQLAANSISAKDVLYDRKSKRLFLKYLKLDIERQQHFFLDNYFPAVQLKEMLGARFYRNEQDEILVEVAGMRAYIQSAEEILVLKRLLIDGVYNMSFSRPAIVLDVGMNVGLVALYFANQHEVHVIGCEPYKKTYQQALRNISLNPDVYDKILTYQVGVGDTKFKTVAMCYPRPVPYAHWQFKGSDEDMFPKFEYEEIDIEGIANMIDSILLKYPERDVVLVVNYENKAYHIDGISEYHIIDRLCKSGRLKFVRALMVEWHRQDPRFLVHQLRDWAFRVFLFSPHDLHRGMLYAVRENSPEAISDL